MKKYGKTVILGSIMVLLCVGYFFYLSRRTPTIDATDKAVQDQEIAALTTRNIEDNYPETPKEVVKFYARITKAYYKTELDEEKIEALGKQARLLFDSELKGKQTDEQFLQALKDDIKNYRSLNRYVADYVLQEGSEVNYSTFQGQKYAFVNVVYKLREKETLIDSNTKFTLRQDRDGRWKILYWELVK
ncbi:MAG: hypothetical protein HFJ03_05195 [Lachnospira sp.]|jgi:hypothetical protein|nr:hypothetical protein [Lachnospira sp.]